MTHLDAEIHPPSTTALILAGLVGALVGAYVAASLAVGAWTVGLWIWRSARAALGGV